MRFHKLRWITILNEAEEGRAKEKPDALVLRDMVGEQVRSKPRIVKSEMRFFTSPVTCTGTVRPAGHGRPLNLFADLMGSSVQKPL